MAACESNADYRRPMSLHGQPTGIVMNGIQFRTNIFENFKINLLTLLFAKMAILYVYEANVTCCVCATAGKVQLPITLNSYMCKNKCAYSSDGERSTCSCVSMSRCCLSACSADRGGRNSKLPSRHLWTHEGLLLYLNGPSSLQLTDRRQRYGLDRTMQ